MKKLLFLLMLLATLLLTPLSTLAIDFSDCEDTLSRLVREAKNAPNNIDTIDALRDAQNSLKFIEDRLDKAKRACNVSSKPIDACSVLRDLSRNRGRAVAQQVCRVEQNFIRPGFCDECLGK